MSSSKDRLRRILATNGYSVTKARLTVFELLDSPGPRSISEIQARAKAKIDRVSVYRNIELFVVLGIVRRVYLGWKAKYELSDKFRSHHHHLTCLNCSKVIDIKDEKHLDSFINQVSKEFAFKPSGHQFEIEGLCFNCSKLPRAGV